MLSSRNYGNYDIALTQHYFVVYGHANQGGPQELSLTPLLKFIIKRFIILIAVGGDE